MKILVLHQSELVRVGISTVLDAELIGADNLEQALVLVGKYSPDCAIVEPLQFPDAVSKLESLLPVVILTSGTGEHQVLRAMAEGAMAYVHLTEPSSALVNAVRSALEGTPTLSTQTANGIMHKLAELRRSAIRVPVLSNREAEVVLLLATGLTNRQIAQRLSLAEGTVMNYCSRAFGKLGVKNRVQATLWAIRAGLVTADEQE